MNEEIRLGRYKHFKGKEYLVTGVGRDVDNPESKFVIYEQLYDAEEFPLGTIWIRELEDFTGYKEVNGEKVKRFEYVGEW